MLSPTQKRSYGVVAAFSDYTTRQALKDKNYSQIFIVLTIASVVLFYFLLFTTYIQRHVMQSKEEVIVVPTVLTETIPTTTSSIEVTWNSKQLAIQSAFKHAYGGYSKYAFGHDELRPTTNETNDSWGAMAVTIIDSLDTMYMLNLKTDFEKALQYIRNDMNIDQNKMVSFFETSIRYIGGLLSAYDLSQEELLLQKAIQLADKLLHAFNEDTKLPHHEVNLMTGESRNAGWTGHGYILSEIGSIQLEFQHLSYLSGNPIYAQKVNEAFDKLVSLKRPYPGLYPVIIDQNGNSFQSQSITIGGLAGKYNHNI
jgi:hypothetical protein